MARGLRNNNPGNLVKTAIKWQGKVPHSENTDSRFEKFVAMKWGVRAMIIDVLGDIEKDGMNTIEKLITKYAPPHENNTKVYINVVAKAVGIAPNEKIPMSKEALRKLFIAITKHENGTPISESDFEEGFALVPLKKKLKM